MTTGSTQSAPSVNGRSEQPVVIFDSVFLTVSSCISFLLIIVYRLKGDRVGMF